MVLETKKYQPLIGVIGLPRSGTTILSNLLNSCQNGFCVVEPIWAHKARKASEFTTPKTGAFVIKPYNIVPSQLRSVITSHGFGFGGIKETHRNHQSFCVDVVMRECDIVLCSIRDPVATFSSWRRMKWGFEYDSAKLFINNYLILCTRVSQLAHTKPVIVVNHEELCTRGIEYFNQCFKEEGKLIGELALESIQDNFSMGDGRARNSASFQPGSSISNLSNYERAIITKSLWWATKQLASISKIRRNH